MSKNNLIKKSDKKFIRREKARIRGLFLDVAKQEEMISEIYKRFAVQPSMAEVSKTEDKPAIQNAKFKSQNENLKSKIQKKKLKKSNKKVHPVK